jgi:hypothetical protein
MITNEELRLLFLQAGGAVLGLIVFYWTRLIVLGRKK